MKKKCWNCKKIKQTKNYTIYEDLNPEKPCGKANLCKKCLEEEFEEM